MHKENKLLKASVYSRLLECGFSFFFSGGGGGRDNIFFVASSTHDGFRNLHKDCNYYDYKLLNQLDYSLKHVVSRYFAVKKINTPRNFRVVYAMLWWTQFLPSEVLANLHINLVSTNVTFNLQNLRVSAINWNRHKLQTKIVFISIQATCELAVQWSFLMRIQCIMMNHNVL